LEIVDDTATRSRILARLAVDLGLTDPIAGERAAQESLRLARDSQDRTALLESLLRRASFSLTPHSLELRQSALQEVLELSSRATDVVTRFFALSSSVVTAIQSGNVTEADSLSGEADTIAAHYDLAPLRWSTMARHAWRAGLDGSFEQAEALIREAWDYGDRHGVSHAPESGRLQRGMLRWQQDRTIEVLPTARAIYGELGARFPGVALILARALAEDCARHDEARVLLSEVAANSFERLPFGTFWSSALVVTAETACILELPDVCATIRDLLLPFTDQVAFTGLWVVAPIAYGVGVASVGCDDRRASQHFDRAADIAMRMHAPVLAARAREPRLTPRG
jgi:hypothetical protein